MRGIIMNNLEKKIVILVNNYWELSWLAPIAKYLDLPIYFVNPLTDKQGFRQRENTEGFVLVTTNYYDGENWDLIDKFYTSGRKVVMIQHAFDSALHLRKEIWNHPTDHFTHYCVNSQQDYDWLYRKYSGKVFMTGSPHLDEIRNLSFNKEEIYQKVGVEEFIVATTVNGLFHTEDETRKYWEYLESVSRKKHIVIVLKQHPGGGKEGINDICRKYGFIAYNDSRVDYLDTWKLVQCSQGVITPYSFMGIEAILMSKRVDIHPIGLNELAKRDMFKDRHGERFSIDIKRSYLCDSRNTQRVADLLRRL